MTRGISRERQVKCPQCGHEQSLMEVLFWSQVEITDDCWLWRGAKTPAGYGQVRQANRQKLVHRVAYEWLVGPIPQGLVLDHLCEIRVCIRPDHLEPVTQQVNIERARGKLTTCPHGHPLDGYCRNGTARAARRYCKTCDQAKSRRKNAQRKARRLGQGP